MTYCKYEKQGICTNDNCLFDGSPYLLFCPICEAGEEMTIEEIYNEYIERFFEDKE